MSDDINTQLKQITIQEVANDIAGQLINTETQIQGLSAQLQMITSTLKTMREKYVNVMQKLFKKVDEQEKYITELTTPEKSNADAKAE